MSKNKAQENGAHLEEQGSEPLSNFQTPATGRKDIEAERKNGEDGSVKTLKVIFSKIKILKKGTKVKLEFSKIESDGTTTSGSEDFSALPHKDFINALNTMAPHWLICAGYIKPIKIPDIENVDKKLIDNVTITGITIEGDEDDGSLQIHGFRPNYLGQSVNANTPKISLNEEAEKPYDFIEDAVEKRNLIISEALLFLEGTKRAPDPQGKIDFPEKDKFGDERDEFTAGEAN